MKIEKGKISPGSATSSNVMKVSSLQGSTKKSNRNSVSPSSQTNDYNNSSLNSQKEQVLTKTNIERHNKESMERLSISRGSKHRKKGGQHTTSSDVECDNGNISPLYSNWDQEMQEHLLPLQHYIIEQAKLSGCYGLGDQLDSDSLHSDSQSEHSFSGHEPDNEDSDHSDERDYLTHNYPVDEEYGIHRGGVSYYNMDFYRNEDKEDMYEFYFIKKNFINNYLFLIDHKK